MKAILAALTAALALALVFSMGGNASEDADQSLRDTLQKTLAASIPGVEITELQTLPLEALVELELNHQDRVYATRDGRFLLVGRLLEVTDAGPVDLTEQRLSGVRKEALAQVSPDQMVTFAAPDQKAEVFVFTDPTCGYCRRLHQEITETTRHGITVHYLAFPRGGMQSPGAAQMQSVWCARDRNKAMDDAKLRQQVRQTEACNDPVAEQYSLGQRLGVRGTPAIYDAEGRSLGGYLPTGQLVQALGL
jgi:thiol:disulfide interchange protein DsbC